MEVSGTVPIVHCFCVLRPNDVVSVSYRCVCLRSDVSIRSERGLSSMLSPSYEDTSIVWLILTARTGPCHFTAGVYDSLATGGKLPDEKHECT